MRLGRSEAPNAERVTALILRADYRLAQARV